VKQISNRLEVLSRNLSEGNPKSPLSGQPVPRPTLEPIISGIVTALANLYGCSLALLFVIWGSHTHDSKASEKVEANRSSETAVTEYVALLRILEYS
jgi:hypothetical protein